VANSLLAPNSGLLVAPGSISLVASAPSAVQLYDGSLAPLGIGSGLLLTTGMAPGVTNSVGSFGSDNSTVSGAQNGSAAIDAVINSNFQTASYDATMLSFNFTVTDPAATSISFNVVFGSEEYPEWANLFVDTAVVIVNGVNYAFFSSDPKSALSVGNGNVAAGYFRDNSGNVLPIEYDGVSRVLKIVAPIIPGQVNNINPRRSRD
jgi:hypothetical protein